MTTQKPKPGAQLTLKVLPVRKLGVPRGLLLHGPVATGCRASAGGSCKVDCTTMP